MTKIISFFTALLMTLSTAFSAVNPFHRGNLKGEAKTYSIVNREIPSFSFDEAGEFTILQMTDMHLDMGRKRDETVLAQIAEQVDAVKPDLVAITGDMLDGHSTQLFRDKRASLKSIAALFEERAQYWAYVPGNNDGEVLGTAADIAAFLGKNYKFCIVGNAANITGETHYVIPIENNGTVVHQLVFMDSGMRDPATKYKTYDCFKPDQADWLKAQLASGTKSTLFFHMNTPAFTQAISDVWDNIPGNKIIDDVIEAAGCVGLVSIGHIHPPVNWLGEWSGRYYQVVRADGGSKITISAAGGYQFEELVY